MEGMKLLKHKSTSTRNSYAYMCIIVLLTHDAVQARYLPSSVSICHTPIMYRHG